MKLLKLKKHIKLALMKLKYSLSIYQEMRIGTPEVNMNTNAVTRDGIGQSTLARSFDALHFTIILIYKAMWVLVQLMQQEIHCQKKH